MTSRCRCFFILLLAALLFPGCAIPEVKNPSAGNLQLRNPAGQVVMTADFEFPQEPLTPGKNFTGRWRPLETAKEVPPAWHLDLTGWAKYHAELAAEGMSVDLSFGNADNNLYLLGPQKNGQFTGEWSYSTIAGSRTMGNFTLRAGP